MPAQTESLAARLRELRQVRREQVSGAENSARALVLVAFALPLVVVIVLAVIVAVTIASAGGNLGGLGTAIGSAWLAVHQVPLNIGGVSLGALPMLPTILLVVAAVRAVRPAVAGRRTVYELGALFAAAVGGPLLITALAMAIVLDGQSVFPVQCPPPLEAFGCTALVHLTATAIAVVSARWREWAAARRLTLERIADIADAVRWGAICVLTLFTFATMVIAVMLLVRHGSVADLIGAGNGFDGYLGLVVLSVLYLPNLAVAGAGALVGADANVGLASLDLLNAHGGAVPPLPLLAVLPDGEVGLVAVLGFLIPIGVAVVAGLRARSLDPLRNVRRVALTGASAALIMVLASWAAGGDLGELGVLGGSVPVVGVFTFGIIALPGLVVALVYGLLPATRLARAGGVPAETAASWDGEYAEDEYAEDEYAEDEYLVDEYPGDAFADDETDDLTDDVGDETDLADGDPRDSGLTDGGLTDGGLTNEASEYHEYYLDGDEDDDFDYDPAGYAVDDTSASAPETALRQSDRRRPTSAGRETYEDFDYLDDEESEVIGRGR